MIANPGTTMLLIISPIFISILYYFIINLFVKQKKKSFHKMISWTTFTYIIAVLIVVKELTSINLFGIMPIVLILILAIILIIQWKTKTEVILMKGLKLLWRLLFLLFIPLYIGLVGYFISIKYILI